MAAEAGGGGVYGGEFDDAGEGGVDAWSGGGAGEVTEWAGDMAGDLDVGDEHWGGGMAGLWGD